MPPSDRYLGYLFAAALLVRHPPYAGGVLIPLALVTGLGAMVLQAFSNYAGRLR
jgi:hypothetical protein